MVAGTPSEVNAEVVGGVVGHINARIQELAALEAAAAITKLDVAAKIKELEHREQAFAQVGATIAHD